MGSPRPPRPLWKILPEIKMVQVEHLPPKKGVDRWVLGFNFYTSPTSKAKEQPKRNKGKKQTSKICPQMNEHVKFIKIYPTSMAWLPLHLHQPLFFFPSSIEVEVILPRSKLQMGAHWVFLLNRKDEMFPSYIPGKHRKVPFF